MDKITFFILVTLLFFAHVETCIPNIRISINEVTQSRTLDDEVKFEPFRAIDGDTETCSRTPKYQPRWYFVHLLDRKLAEVVVILVGKQNILHTDDKFNITATFNSGTTSFKQCCQDTTDSSKTDPTIYSTFSCSSNDSEAIILGLNITNEGYAERELVICEIYLIGKNSTTGLNTESTRSQPTSTEPYDQHSMSSSDIHIDANDNFNFGATINSGVSSSKHRCLHTRNLSEDVFCCYPGQPAFGFYSPVKSYYQVNEKVQFTCIKNYHFFGSRERTCTTSGDWDGNIPLCLKSIKITELITETKFLTRLTDDDPETCISINVTNKNTILQIPLKKTVKFWEIVFQLELYDEFTGKDHIVISVSNTTNTSAHTTIPSLYVNGSCKGVSVPRTVNVSFFPKYQEGKYINIKLQDLSCMKICNLRLSTVDRIKCGIPEIPLNGIINRINGGNEEVMAVYSCDEGYSLIGDEFRKCFNGVWSDKPPQCRLKNLKIADNRSESFSNDSSGNVSNLLIIILISVCLFIIVGIIISVVILYKKLSIKKNDNSMNSLKDFSSKEQENQIRPIFSSLQKHEIIENKYEEMNSHCASAAQNRRVNVDEGGYLIPNETSSPVYEEIKPM